VERVNSLYRELKSQSDSELCERFQALRKRAADLAQCQLTLSDDQFIANGFSCIKEAGRRALNMELYDVQMLAGIAMVRGNVAEMATGEGKTLVAALPACVFALWGKGVHIMTTNAYLAQRDCELMGPLYRMLGLSVDLIFSQMPRFEKHDAYLADITYGVGNEFGFDYLRDQSMLHQMPKPAIGSAYRDRLRGQTDEKIKPLQRGHAFAVIDEADSVMIDDANSTLILSGSSGLPHPQPEPYKVARAIFEELVENKDYVVADTEKKVSLSSAGMEKIVQRLDRDTRLSLTRPWETYVVNAIYTDRFYSLDIDYIIKDEAIQIIDESTGRRLEDRSWSNGLHQAVEAKEGVPITEESASYLKISRQRFFQSYQVPCSMTGTALDCEQEFKRFYHMSVKKVPLHKKSRRKYLPIKFFASREEKRKGVSALVRKVHLAGTPILIGTRNVKDSESLSELIHTGGIKCNVLNARHDQFEAEIIKKAGKKFAVTVATNMAGRGTDIPIDKEVEDLGGLFVIVFEPHLSQRLDRQFIGRCARQGEPGTAVMLSCQDDEIFQIARFTGWSSLKRNKKWDPEKLAIQIRELQSKLDTEAYLNRQQLMRRDKWQAELLNKLT
jgi:preprotein translocase subunit SecA